MRPALRGAFLDLCRRPAAEYVGKFGFKSDLLKVGIAALPVLVYQYINVSYITFVRVN